MNNPVEFFLLDLGFSWTLAKFLPYFFTLLFGFFLWKLTTKIRLSFWLRIPLGVSLFLLPFSLYFFFFPIYQPDLFNETYRPKVLPNEKPKCLTLAVVVLPGCPYCLQTAAQMNRLAAQNTKLKIVYYFISEDPSAARIFRKTLNERIELRYTQDATLWMMAAEGVFPSYLLFDNKRLKRAWHNTTFGVRALDELRNFK